MFHGEYHAALDEIATLLSSRVFRGWHYTRLTDAETDAIATRGIRLSTQDFFIERLIHVVLSNGLTEREGKQICADSVLSRGQLNNRSNRFWVASNPVPYDDPGVKRLLEFWGGEVASFWQENAKLLAKLSAIGKPRIIEIAMPLAKTDRAWHAARSVVSTFSESNGVKGDFNEGFDACCFSPLSAEAVLRIHTEGDPSI